MDDLIERIAKKYRDQLLSLQRKLFTDAGEAGLSRPPAAIGPCNAITDRFAAVTVAADITPLRVLEPDSGLDGSVLTISVRGRNRILGSQITLPRPESDAWAAAVAGTKWAPHLYMQGALSGTGPMSTMYYRIFLGPDHSPTTPTGQLSEHVTLLKADD